jgi:CRP-like cAMP-binding protein
MINTSVLLASINRHITLEPADIVLFTAMLQPAQIKQGEFIETSGTVTPHFIHVLSGCLMTYYSDKNGHDHVIQFAMAGWWTGDLHSFTEQVPSIYSTRALADSEVLYLPKADMDRLLAEVPKFERFFRILFQNSLVTHQQRIIQNFSANAEERYENFRKKYPSLEQYVPLKYIASYLGFTPEFLSKIRRKQLDR